MKNQVLIFVLLSLTGAECLDLLDEEQLRAEAVFIGGITSRDIQQRLIPDIHFTCRGTLSKWTIVASKVWGGSRYPELQIWRRTGNGNEYERVGRTQFSSSSVEIRDRVFEQTLDPPLNFEPGYVLGVYTPPVPRLTFKYQKKGGPTNYYIGGPATPYSRFSLDNGLVLSSQNDYPLVSVEVNGTDCTSGFIDRNTLLLKASLLTVNNSDLEYKGATQRVIPDLMFTESGELDGFTLGALHTGSASGRYPEIQLWRAAGDREWVKVLPTQSSPAVSRTPYLNMYQYQYYPPLQVQAGDVLGIYQPYSLSSALKLYYQQDGPLNYYRQDIASSENSLQENGGLIYSRTNRPLLTVMFRPDSPATTSTTASPSPDTTIPDHTGTTMTTSDHTTGTTAAPTFTQPSPVPSTSRSITRIIILVCVTVLVLVVVVVALLALLVFVKTRMDRHPPNEPPVNQRDELEKSLDYNAVYPTRNPREVIVDGKKQVVDLAINRAYVQPKLETVEHIYDIID